ncbi:hypothetical protein K0U83_26355 [bacterium]|nr:hypothetical protein [bacterium]
MTFHEFMFAAIAVFAIVLAYFANRQCSEVIDSWSESIRQWNESNQGWARSNELTASMKRKAASFHRRSQQYESQCCRLRRDLCGETIRANWWKSEAKRLGWKPEREPKR